MKQITKRFISMIGAFALLAAAFVVYLNFIQPAYQDAQRVKGEVLSRESLIETQRTVVNQVQNLINTYQGQGQLQEAVSLALSPHADVGGALTQLNGLVAGSRLAVQIVLLSGGGGAPLGTPSSTLLVKPMSSVTFRLRFIGAYNDFKDFLKKLETNIRIFDVNELTIQEAGKPTQDLYSYDISVTTYYQNP